MLVVKGERRHVIGRPQLVPVAMAIGVGVKGAADRIGIIGGGDRGAGHPAGRGKPVGAARRGPAGGMRQEVVRPVGVGVAGPDEESAVAGVLGLPRTAAVAPRHAGGHARCRFVSVWDRVLFFLKKKS